MIEPSRHEPDLLEIGYVGFFKRLMPERTTFVAVEAPEEEHALAGLVLRQGETGRLAALLERSPASALILRVNHHPGPLLDEVFSLVGRGAWRSARRRLPFGPAGRGPRRLVLLDFEDEAYLHAGVRALLPAATHVYKRELPVDRWRLLAPGDAARDEAAHRANPDDVRLLEKIRPLPLGLPLDERRHLLPGDAVPKRTDVFFAGRVAASAWSRPQGLAELGALRRRGIAVDIADAPLAPAAFYARSAAARLTWSPDGYGWDCFRHYEAAACRSVALAPYPTTERFRGLAHGVHAWFYDPAPGGLSAAVLEALADGPRLERMGDAARALVLAHHTPEAIARRILDDIGVQP